MLSYIGRIVNDMVYKYLTFVISLHRQFVVTKIMNKASQILALRVRVIYAIHFIIHELNKPQ